MISQYTKQGYHGSNQDACGYLELDDKVIMAVADGHGHYLHFRSDIGAKLAVDSFIDIYQNCTSDPKELKQKESEIQPLWLEKVDEFHNQNIVSSYEWARTREYAQNYIDKKIPIEIAYGSTLLGAVYFKQENKLFILRIGDGEIMKVSLFHTVNLLKKNDYGSDYVTESICEIPAKIKDNLEMDSFNNGLTQKDLFVLASDGLTKFKNKKEIVHRIRKDPNNVESILSKLDNADDLTLVIYKL